MPSQPIDALTARGAGMLATDLLYLLDPVGEADYKQSLTDFFGNIPAAVVVEVSETVEGDVTITTDSATALTVETAAGADILLVDTATPRVTIGGGLTTAGAILRLATAEPTVVANDVLGRINFVAPLEASGTDAILTGASIVAQAEAEFTASVNATSLLFQTGASGVATTKYTMTSDAVAVTQNSTGLGVNTTPGYRLDVSHSTNTTAGIRTSNPNVGTATKASVRVAADACEGDFHALSSGYTTSNQYIADSVLLESAATSSGGLGISAAGAYPIKFWTNSTLAATIDSSQNVGVGVTPEAWTSIYGALQLHGMSLSSSTTQDSNAYSHLMHGAYHSTTYKYLATGPAVTLYEMSYGRHIFKVAAAGTADASISWTTALTIASGWTPHASTPQANIDCPAKTINTAAGAATYATGAGGLNVGIPTLTATNAVTATDCATLRIAGVPVASTNVTITNPWALWVDAGNVRLDGIIAHNGTMGDSAKNPTTDAPADWVECKIGASTYYIPVYAAS